jgi:large subunit ribosomal protein L4
MEIPLKNSRGEAVGNIEVSEQIFNIPFRAALVHQVMVAHLANRRVGTASTKTRAQVRGGKAKPWRQKGTGRARQGSRVGPHWRGGGVTFGPKPRDYHQNTPKKMRRLAICCLLAQRAREGQITVLEELEIPGAKTRESVRLLANLKITSKCLVVSGTPAPLLGRAFRNLPRVKSLPAYTLNTLDILNYDHLLMSVDAVRKVEELWADSSLRRRKRNATDLNGSSQFTSTTEIGL